MRTVRLQVPGAAKPVEVRVEREGHDADRLIVTVDGRRHECVLHGDAAGGLLQIGPRVVRFRGARHHDVIDVWVDGRTVRLERVERTARRSGGADAAAAGDELVAPMPGKVLVIKTDVGASFEAHTPLIVMESMKMEMTLAAPRAGSIAEIRCAEGDLVEMGEVLARLAPAPDEADASAS